MRGPLTPRRRRQGRIRQVSGLILATQLAGVFFAWPAEIRIWLSLLLIGAWTAPRTWVSGELVTAALMNTHLRDQLLILKTVLDNSGNLDLPTATELTIAAGSITPTQNYHRVDTQSEAATDDLDTIDATNVTAGFVLILQAENIARVVTLRDSAGNLKIGSNVVMDATHKSVALYYDGSNWRLLVRPDGKVVQVVAGSYSTQTSSSSSTYADSGLSATITMRNTGNKILVIVMQQGCGKDTGNTYLKLKLLRGAVDLVEFEKQGGQDGGTGANFIGGCGCVYVDTPGGAGVHTYKTQLASGANIANVYAQAGSSLSTIILIEFEP